MGTTVNKAQSLRDPNWPTARSWLAGAHKPGAQTVLRVVGVPLAQGSITPSRCDLAPAAIRHSLEGFSTYDVVQRLDLGNLRVDDVGDLAVEQLSVEEAGETIIRAVAQYREAAEAIVLLGGNNAITRAALLGVTVPLSRCGLLTFDAHLDLRDMDHGLNNGNPIRALLSEGLPGENIVQIGIQSFANSGFYMDTAIEAGITTVPMEQVAESGIDTIVQGALRQLASRVETIYVDLDMDVLDRSFAPGTAGARPGGMTPLLLRRAAHLCGQEPKVQVLDLVELDPSRDITETTALTAASCLLSFASGVLRRQGAITSTL